MALQLVLDANGNYVYQDVKTSQQNITSKDFEAYEGDTKTTLATGSTNLGAQTDKLIRELPGTLTTDVDPTTGEVTTKGRTQQVAIEQKPMGESAASAVTPINPFDKVQSIINQTPMSGASAADKERIYKLIQDQQKLNQSAQKFDQITQTLDMGMRAYNMFSGKNVGTPPINPNVTPLTNIGNMPIGSSTVGTVGTAGAIAYGLGTAFKVKPKERTGMTAGAAIGTAVGGPVGGVIGGILGGVLGCFLPDTLVSMADGSKKKIIDIELKDNIAIGGFVFATGKFLITDLYDYKGIKVSGTHMVNEEGIWKEVKDTKHGKSLGNDEQVVYTLGADKRRILINNILFTDYFEVEEKDKLREVGDTYFDSWRDNVVILNEKNKEILNAS